MKKKLESELVSIAHRILKLKGKEDVDKMHKEVASLYEKLTVLKFAQENFEDDKPTIGNDSSFFDMLDTAFNNKISDTIEVEDKIYINLDEAEDDDIMEPVMEKIKDIVAQMPQESQQVDDMLQDVALKKPKQHEQDLNEITADYKETPVFERLKEKTPKNKLDNEELKNAILKINKKDKLIFIKHLFNGSTQDYERVISQLNTATTLKDAIYFIEHIVKPDYNDWKDKKEYEKQLIEFIQKKYT